MVTDSLAVRTDLHVHTVASGHAYSTIREVCAEAAGRGLEAVGITDHGPSLPGGAHQYHFSNLVVVPRTIGGVTVLRSAECNITGPAGELDLPERVLDALDLVHVGMHPLCGYEGDSVEENTRAAVAAVSGGMADVLVHPGNPLFPLDYGTVAEAAASNGVSLEINNASLTVVRKGSRENCRVILREAKRVGTPLCVGSDAHDASLVGVFQEAVALADSEGVEEERVVNRDLASLRRFLESRGKEIRF